MDKTASGNRLAILVELDAIICACCLLDLIRISATISGTGVSSGGTSVVMMPSGPNS
jgi:hypothetical protein